MPYLDNTGVEYLVGDLKEKTDAAYQEKLVSGTNIKTVNNNSLLGSGNIDISVSGGGVSVIATTVSIAATAWSSNTCVVGAVGVTSNNIVIISYVPNFKDAYVSSDIYCTGQGLGQLTLTCATEPTSTININVLSITVSDETLKGTTWTINATPTTESFNWYFNNLEFSSNNNEYTQLNIGQGNIRYSLTVAYTEERGGWVSTAYRTISITGGIDATNATLIEWLKANATQVS